MSNRTRQNNKGADRKMESNDSPEIPDRGGGGGGTPEEPGLITSGQKDERVQGRILTALIIDKRTRRREIRPICP